jgi:hypothetical protein
MLLELCLAQASAPSWLSGATVVGSIFWICIAAICIIPSMSYYRHATEKARIEAQLKQQMVERGYGAAEIIAVLKEDPKLLPVEASQPSATPAKPVAEPSVYR